VELPTAFGTLASLHIEGIAKAPLAVGMAMCIAPFLIRTRTPTLIPWGVIFDERGFAGVAPIGSGEMIAL